VYADSAEEENSLDALAGWLDHLGFSESAEDLYSSDPEEVKEAIRQGLIILKENTEDGLEWIFTRDILALQEVPFDEDSFGV
jgi:hypothetical protein